MTAALSAGTEVAGYRIEGVLGHGGMGIVYAARQLSLGRTVALKVLATEGGAAQERFRREAELQAGLEHEHVVTVFEAGRAPEGLFIAMRLIGGGTLKAAIGDGLEPERAVSLLAPVASALDAAHAAGLIHRDVKPQNILLDGDDRAYLADFGLVKPLDGVSLTEAGGFMGTPDYVAPEQVRGEPATAASDVYSLAAVLYEALTGTVVFAKDNVQAALYAHTTETPVPVTARRPGLPPALDGVLARGLAKDPADRPPGAGALMTSAAEALAPGATATAGAARRLVTVVCAGFAGTEDDPELQHAAMAGRERHVADVAGRHGGTVRRTSGDEILAVFGLDALHEDDAQRAVRAALELRDAEVRLGVESGLVFVEDGTPTGAALQTAAELQRAARPGEVELGPQVRRLAGHLVAGEPAPQLPFVGRQDELRTLRDVIARAREERACRLVTVIGPAGIGKSRLARELTAELDGTVLVGRCVPYGDGVTYQPLVEMLGADAVVGTGPEEIALTVRRRLEAATPVVAVLEDAHWAKPTLLDLIDYVAAFSSGAAVVIVCLARPELLELRPDWAAPQANRTLISPAPLSDAEAQRLAAGVDPARAAAIVATAEGNPLFVEQLLAVEDPGDTLPPSIQAVLAARIDALEPGERGVLERASVVGRSFAVAALGAAATQDLLALVRKQMIRPEAASEDTFRFAHALVRDAAYEGLSRARRSELHEGVATWLKARDDTDDELIGHHLERAHRYRAGGEDRLAHEAARRFETASGAALARGDLPAGVSLLERSVDLLGPDSPAAVALGAALFESGRLQDAERVLAAALERAEDPAERARADVELHMVALHAGTGTIEPARAAADHAIRLLWERGDELGVCRAWLLHAWTHWTEGEAAVADAGWQKAAELARRAGARRELHASLGWSASAAAFGPLPVEPAIRRCEAIAEEVRGSAVAEAWVQRPLALLHALGGDFERARALLGAANATLDELAGMHSVISHHEAQVEMLAGAPERAELRLRADYERLQAMGEHALLATTAAMLAQAVFAQGRAGEASELCDVSRRHADDGDHGTQALWRTVEARILAGADRIDAAEALVREGLARVERTDALTERGDALMALADVLAAGGRDAEARSAELQAAELYDRKGATARPAR